MQRKRNIKRLWHNLATLRSHEVTEAIRSKTTLVLIHDGKRMTLTPEQLEHGHSGIGARQFKSKINSGQTFHLVDYNWKEDAAQVEMEL